MSVKPSQDRRRVLEKLVWVRTGSSDRPAVELDWQTAAKELFDALDEALNQLDAAGLCRGCGKPVGSYCLECAWPHKRRSERLRSR